MEMHQVRYFLAVCETLNFTRAAELCNVSQPALTRAVHKLEEELGGLLLRRENSLTHLTDFGRLVRPHLEQMMAQAEAAKSTAMQFLRMDSAPINLGVMCTVGPMRFMSFLAEFHATHPGCEVTLIEGVPGRLAELLLAGKLDLAVMAQPEAFSDRLEVGPLYRERFCVAFPMGHRFREKNRVRIPDVAGETYLARINCEYQDHLNERCREHGFALRIGFRSEREDWIQMMVAAGFASALSRSFRRPSPASSLGSLRTRKSPARSRWCRSPAGAFRRRSPPSRVRSGGTGGPRPRRRRREPLAALKLTVFELAAPLRAAKPPP
jgi:LysR family transcriptional regulator, hydrogen peroxide-inducible genes activator